MKTFVLNILRVFTRELAAATLGLQMCNPRPSSHFRVENLYWRLSDRIFRHTSSVFYVNEQFVTYLMAAF